MYLLFVRSKQATNGFFCKGLCSFIHPRLWHWYCFLGIKQETKRGFNINTVFNLILVVSFIRTGKSLSEALIFASTNPQYDNKLQVQYMKTPCSEHGRTCCEQKLFLTFRTITVHNMFSPCSAKRRASDKDLCVIKNQETLVFSKLFQGLFDFCNIKFEVLKNLSKMVVALFHE